MWCAAGVSNLSRGIDIWDRVWFRILPIIQFQYKNIPNKLRYTHTKQFKIANLWLLRQTDFSFKRTNSNNFLKLAALNVLNYNLHG